MSKFSDRFYARRAQVACIAMFTLATGGWSVAPPPITSRPNLVSSVPGLATITDPLLVNPWGVSRSPTSRSGPPTRGRTRARYIGDRQHERESGLTVNANGFVGIPTTGAGPRADGQVNNTNTRLSSWCRHAEHVGAVHLRQSQRHHLRRAGDSPQQSRCRRRTPCIPVSP